MVQAHIFQHLFDYVELHPIFKDGKPHQTGYSSLYPLYKTGYTFYVDARGILKEPKEARPPWNKKKDNPNLIETKDTSVFFIRRASDGTWFKASLGDWPDAGDLGFLLHHNSEWVVETMGERLIKGRCVKIRTLSKKEKKKLGIV